MVRNIDLAEAIIFYGGESLYQNGAEFLPGVENMLEECKRDETAVLAILEANTSGLPSSSASSMIQARIATQPPPNPRDLWEAIHSIVIQPKGFGGSSGFGSKAADTERPPLPKHCVVLCHTEHQCRAARYAGMRVLCLTDNALADAVLFEGDWESICVDDIATPGSFWLNPPHPRDDESNSVDVDAVMEAYENPESYEATIDDQNAADGEMDRAQLAAILADMDPL